jgi:hypothetical protein
MLKGCRRSTPDPRPSNMTGNTTREQRPYSRPIPRDCQRPVPSLARRLIEPWCEDSVFTCETRNGNDTVQRRADRRTDRVTVRGLTQFPRSRTLVGVKTH